MQKSAKSLLISYYLYFCPRQRAILRQAKRQSDYLRPFGSKRAELERKHPTHLALPIDIQQVTVSILHCILHPNQHPNFQHTVCSKICTRLWNSVFQGLKQCVPNFGRILAHSVDQGDAGVQDGMQDAVQDKMSNQLIFRPSAG